MVRGLVPRGLLIPYPPFLVSLRDKDKEKPARFAHPIHLLYGTGDPVFGRGSRQKLILKTPFFLNNKEKVMFSMNSSLSPRIMRFLKVSFS